MQSGIIEKVRENTKVGYKSTYGQLSIHTFTIGGVDYEYHSKSNSVKQKPGELMWFTVTTDKQGNLKLKPEKAPETGNTNTPIGNSVTLVPGTQANLVPVNNPNLRFEIFKALCILKSGSPAPLEQSLPALLKEVDQLMEKFK